MFLLQPYSIDLKKPLVLPGHILTKKQGIWVKFKGKVGDIAPLPGYSEESFEQAYEQAQKLCENPDSIDQALSICYPSVRFGFETVLAKSVEISKNTSIFHQRMIALNDVHFLDKIQTMFKQGGRLIKLKISRMQPFEVVNALEILAKLPEALQCRFRIDCNQYWTLPDLMIWVPALDPFRIDFFEEPLKNLDEFETFFQSTGYGYALDENLSYELLQKCILEYKGLRAIVIKPSLKGGYLNALNLAFEAKKAGLTSVISSSYESEFGVLALAHLAFQTGSDLGCDTLDLFSSEFSAHLSKLVKKPHSQFSEWPLAVHLRS